MNNDIETMNDLLKLLATSDDKATVDKLLAPILSAAATFYHRIDDEQKPTPADPALCIAHYVVRDTIDCKMDELHVKAVLDAVTYLAAGFLFANWADTSLSAEIRKRLAVIVSTTTE